MTLYSSRVHVDVELQTHPLRGWALLVQHHLEVELALHRDKHALTETCTLKKNQLLNKRQLGGRCLCTNKFTHLNGSSSYGRLAYTFDFIQIKIRSKTRNRLKERFLIGRNRTKRAKFRGSPLFRATHNIKTEKKTQLIQLILCQLDVRRLAEGKGHETDSL